MSIGSSPHTRDKCDLRKDFSYFIGIIPAYAGQIFSCFHAHKGTEDHPRIRGTNAEKGRREGSGAGSSPHTRDKLLQNTILNQELRIIPAYAGQIG